MNLANQSASLLETNSLKKISLMLLLSVVMTALSAFTYLVPALHAPSPVWIKPVAGFGTFFFLTITIMWVRLVIQKRRMN